MARPVSAFGSSACGPIGLSCGVSAADYSAASIAALSGALGASASSAALSAGSMGLLARACSRGGVWLHGGRRTTATLMLAAGAHMLAALAQAQTTCDASPPSYDGQELNGTTMSVDTGQTACNTKINKGGEQNVRNGGSATNTAINNAGGQNVYFGGSATSTTINNGGRQEVYFDGSATDTAINGGGWQDVYSRGRVSGTTINRGGQGVHDGGRATDTTINGGMQEVYDGGVASATTIKDGGVQYVYNVLSGGCAEGTVIENNGAQYVLSGALASKTTIEQGGTQYVGKDPSGAMTPFNGPAKVDGTTISGGKQVVYDGSEATNTTIEGGSQVIEAGGQVRGETKGYGTIDLVGGSALVVDGGTRGLSSLTASGGALTVKGSVVASGSGSIGAQAGAELKMTGNLTVSGSANAAVQTLSDTAQTLSVQEQGALILGGGTTTPPTQADFDALRALGGNSATTALRGVQADKATIEAKTVVVEQGRSTVGQIANFENLYFILPDGTRAGETMLTIDGGAPTRFDRKPNIGVAIAGGTPLLTEGDSVTLLRNSAGLQNTSGAALTDADYTKVKVPARQGISVDYDFDLSTDGKTIVAGLAQQPQPEPRPIGGPQPTPGRINPQTKSVVEGNIAAMGALNLASDQVARITSNLPQGTGGGAPNFNGGKGAGTGGAGTSTNGAGTGGVSPNDATVFAQLSGYGQKLESGSHVNVKGAAAIVGAAKVLPLANGGTAAVGAFFEYGDGTFKTHNDFETGTVRGKGDSSYYGAGVMAKATLAGNSNGAPFVEGSLHAGSIRNNWHTDDLRDAVTGARAQYNLRTPYMGAHVGAGYRWQTGAASSVEAYGQYLYTHMDGKDTNVALDPYHFSAVKSSRARLGAKGTWAVSNQTQAYAGAAWEHEFDGTARATAYTFDVPTPTMKGNSAVIDAGLSFQPKRNLTTNVGVTGYAGKRQGAAANVEVQYLF